MESIRVDICYRPLRIAWAISAGDMQSFRKAVRISNALWGGRFDPIVVVDQYEQAKAIVESFRADMIFALGDSESVRAFPGRFPHLVKPFFNDPIFMGNGGHSSSSQVLDIYNAIAHFQHKPEWDYYVKKREPRLYKWSPDDPLADVFLMHLGEYPSPDDVFIDYRQIVKDPAGATELELGPTSQLPVDIFERPSIPLLSRFGLQPHYSTLSLGGWRGPGFYSGDAQDLDDLIMFWNLRAADIPLFFVDPKRPDRYGDTMAAWEKVVRGMVSGRQFDFERAVALWARVDEGNNTEEGLKEIMKPFEGRVSTICRLTPDIWEGKSIRPPTMHLGEVSTLGIVGTQFGKPRVSFALEGEPFSGDTWFHSQALVASLSFIGGLFGDEQHTLKPPFVPELNEFYGRAMHFWHNKLRSEPERVGLVIDASDTSESINALPVGDLIGAIFDLAGFSSGLSSGGLIARQLIAQLGGVDGARAFKIPGVRRLLKTYSPTQPFTKKGAIQLIGSKDPANPAASFSDHEDLYIEPRRPGTKLTPQAVFAFLVEKGLFRIGAELTCPNCRLPSWTALDTLKQHVVCDLCGHGFDATRQLVAEDWCYRRSGVLGKERNAQGAIPVILTLQQFQLNLGEFQSVYSPSLDLAPKAGLDLPSCEIDFIWLIPGHYRDKTVAIIGECKDQGGNRERGKDSGTIDANDIENLRRVAAALPSERFEAFIVLTKLCPFAADEIALAKTLNDKYHRRVILLTAREVEFLHFFDRTKLEFKELDRFQHSAEDLAIATDLMYFR